MRFIPTAAHGLADYVVGLFVPVLPFYFEWTGNARHVFVALGLAVILYSLLTDYEFGAIRFLRIRIHLLLDFLFGVAMISAPPLLHLAGGGSGIVYAIGALSILLSLTTKIRAQGTGSQTVR